MRGGRPLLHFRPLHPHLARPSRDGRVFVKNLTYVPVASLQAALEVMKEGSRFKMVRPGSRARLWRQLLPCEPCCPPRVIRWRTRSSTPIPPARTPPLSSAYMR